MVLGAFGPNDEITAIFLLIAVVLWILGAISASAAKRIPGGAAGLIAAGLAVWFFPQMWNTLERAF